MRWLIPAMRWLLLTSALAVGACQSDEVPKGGDASEPKDAHVVLDASVAPDGAIDADVGPGDAGVADVEGADGSDAAVDAGAADAGLDGGAADATFDAGIDAGFDGGLDADGDGGADASTVCSDPYPVVSSPPAAPYSGTLFINPDIITDTDPTSFVGLSYTGQGDRTMYDRRTASFNTVNAHLFDAQFGANVHVEIQVNPEMNQADATAEVSYYATVIGRLPAFLFVDLQTVWIHRGVQPFGGGNNNLLIHTDQGLLYAADGLLEETFLHEASHTSMDAHHASTARWLEAQTADGTFLSTYARDNPTREDVAETVGPYLAARFRATRIDASTVSTILTTVPSRVAYLDCLGLSMDVLP